MQSLFIQTSRANRFPNLGETFLAACIDVAVGLTFLGLLAAGLGAW